VNGRALYYGSNMLFNVLESVDLLVIYDVPKLNTLRACKDQFVYVGSWVHHYLEIVLKSLLLDDCTSFNVENDEFAFLG
jgi:hypothetical protein